MHNKLLLFSFCIFFTFLLNTSVSAGWFSSKKEIDFDIDIDKEWEFVTFGRTGSRQKVITLTKENFAKGQHWMVFGTSDQSSSIESQRGAKIKCGSKIRLVNTFAFHSLHSHADVKSPLSDNQEVSGYPFESSDKGDEWIVTCMPLPSSSNLKDSPFWRREYPIQLTHSQTNQVLQALPSKTFGNPIESHIEVSCTSKRISGLDSPQVWAATDGFYFKSNK
ncbi:hypothetical protein BB560_006252 [Smittium megazygosporum]|uniref:MIR domain-containing protein n=1 Tax=Smittium megazygosporum TaxID=133381 RepID=A0A2T9YCH0_9FUNG|nr:hypothetical protein BB560_006252 [Smittium megazygosporum]